MEGARSILLSITGGPNLSLWEVNEAAKSVSQAAHPDANIIFGAMVDEKLDDQVWVTVVATGYGDEGRRKSVSRLREPTAGEVRVQRAGPARPSQPRRAGLSVDELDVPEFLPNL
jgi:cell division protein FtsZ